MNEKLTDDLLLQAVLEIVPWEIIEKIHARHLELRIQYELSLQCSVSESVTFGSRTYEAFLNPDQEKKLL